MPLIEQEHFDSDTPVADLLPDFGTRGKEGATVAPLITRASGADEDWIEAGAAPGEAQSAYLPRVSWRRRRAGAADRGRVVVTRRCPRDASAAHPRDLGGRAGRLEEPGTTPSAQPAPRSEGRSGGRPGPMRGGTGTEVAEAPRRRVDSERRPEACETAPALTTVTRDQRPQRGGRGWLTAVVVILVLVALVASLYGCGLPERSAMRDQTAYVAFAAAAVAAGVAFVFNRTGRTH